MFQLASEELHRFDNVTMLQVDALQNKNHLNPVVMEAVARPIGRGAGPAVQDGFQPALQHRHAHPQQPAGRSRRRRRP